MIVCCLVCWFVVISVAIVVLVCVIPYTVVVVRIPSVTAAGVPGVVYSY